nr:MAG TPA: tail protein [Bacteriophage sp.]
MADKAISELVAAEQIKSTDMFVLEQDGTAKRLQGQTLLNWLTAEADGHGGISNIVKTGTDGLVDTYTITLADTTTKTFTVTNGNGLTKFEKLSTVELVDTYRFTRSDGTYFTFAVSNGAKGDTGDASHVWIKYASQQPTANSHSTGDNPDDWMGIYSGTAKTAPTDWQAYKWYQIKGEKGETGAPATVTGVTVEYIVSDSGTIIPSGSWNTTIPSVPQGKYLWTRSTTNFNTGNPAVSYSVSRMGIDGSGSVSSVNDKSPSDSGNVTLTADDIQTSGNASVQDELDNAVKYNTPQSLTAEQQAQARDNIHAPAPYEAGENISITGRIITTKAFPCNPNLLDNWYLGNPVNQRGASGTISTAGYFFDRWKLVSGSVTINSGGIVLNGTIAQVLEYAVGQTVTATVLTPDGVTDVTPVYDDETKTFAVTTQGKTIRAVKLELGFQQTLAHQENGEWVLNEIPKFGDQLAECQRYAVRIGNAGVYRILGTGVAPNANTCGVVVPLPVEMRTIPVATLNGRIALTNAAGVNIYCTNVTVSAFGAGSIELACTASGLSPSAAYTAYLEAGNYLLLSADL